MELKHQGLYNIYLTFAEPFNRTSMELKPRNRTVGLQFFQTFNRTSMELKRPHTSRYLLEKLPFNRTSMELKPVLAVLRGRLSQDF